MQTAQVFNIQRYSIQDGPGIRTTVFFKGCTLHCEWCSNPESIKYETELMLESELCVQCKECIEVCPQNCIEFDDNLNKPVIDRQVCDMCLRCVDNCKVSAIKTVGEMHSIQDVMKQVKRDELFYRNSGGGVTLSGGEAMFQKEFVLELLQELKKHSIHTALDTCGHISWEVLEEVCDYVDLFLFDVKHMDSEKHKQGTGAINEVILENAKRLAEKKKRIWVRIPVVPGYNDDLTNLKATIEFAVAINAEKVSLLGFFNFAKIKYECLDREFALGHVEPMEKEELEKIKAELETIVDKPLITIGH